MLRRTVPLLILALLWSGPVPCAGEEAEGPPRDLEIVTRSLPQGTVGEPYEGRLDATGGAAAGRSWRVVSGTLPEGLALEGGPEALSWTRFKSVGRVLDDDEREGGGGLREVSGLAASLRQPGIVWAHDDSGAVTELFALGPDGRLRQRYRLDTRIRDLEDIALGPGGQGRGDVLYLADIGDNSGRRDHVRLLRVAEPTVPDRRRPSILLRHQAYAFRYPDGPRDAEALLVDWDTGTPYVLDKHRDGGAAYRVPLPLSRAADSEHPATLIRVTEGRPLPPLLTAADAGRDARRVVLRGYLCGWELLRPPGAAFEALFGRPARKFAAPFFGQYETLALSPHGPSLLTMSERLSPDAPTSLMRATALPDTVAGRIRGTPTRRGTASVVCEVRDPSGRVATRRLRIVVR